MLGCHDARWPSGRDGVHRCPGEVLAAGDQCWMAGLTEARVHLGQVVGERGVIAP